MQVSKKAVIFTDMDATLLDHETYDWQPAAAVLSMLAARGVPVCLCTSKTAAEVREWQRRLRLNSPFAAENGAVVGLPPDIKTGTAGTRVVLGQARDSLQALAYRLRRDKRYRFTGFGEISIEAIRAATGLGAADAALAAQREASEPLLWQDTEAAAEAFSADVAAAGAMTRAGGRFLHVLGHADKATALVWLRQRFEADGPILAVALGDSDNDRTMLESADIGYWVAKADGRYHAPAAGHIRHAGGIGPTGWAAAIHDMIERNELPGGSADARSTSCHIRHQQ